MTTGRKRGRPFGTGIDDTAILQELAAMIRIYPDVKPTTALRILGFDDPSDIRRLRDKHKIATRRKAVYEGAEMKSGVVIEIRPASVGGLFIVVADTGRKQFESAEMRLEKCEKLAQELREGIEKTYGVQFSKLQEGGSA